MPKPNTALVEVRLQRGLSQKKLAEALGVSLSTVLRWEKGITRRPFPYHQRKLIEFFGKTHQELGLAEQPDALCTNASSHPQIVLTRPADTDERLHVSHTLEGSAGEPSVVSTIAMSTSLLDEGARLALFFLSLFPPKPNSFSEEAALALAGSDLKTLHILQEAGLVERCPDGRLCLSQAIADYGRAHVSPAERQRAGERFLAFLLQALETHQTDQEWLAKESQVLLFTLTIARELERYREYCALVRAGAPFWLAEGWLLIALDHIQNACDYAKHLRMTALLPRLHLFLGQVYLKTGQYREALTTCQTGLGLARQGGDTEGACALLASASWACQLYGEYAQADAYLTEAWKLVEMLLVSQEQHTLLWALQGIQGWSRGDYSQAEADCSRSVQLFQEIPKGQRAYLCVPLCYLGMIEGYQGHISQAEEWFQQALSATESAGPKDLQIFILGRRGLLRASVHPSKQLREDLGAALLLARDLCAIHASIDIFRALVLVELALGNVSTAEQIAQKALRLTKLAGGSNQQGEILTLLARVALIREDLGQADRYLAEARPLVTQFCPVEEQAITQEARGELALKRGEHAAAQEIFREMARIAPGEHRALQALARYHLACCMAALGSKREARREGEQSLQELEALGHIRVQEVRAWLTSLQPTQPSALRTSRRALPSASTLGHRKTSS